MLIRRLHGQNLHYNSFLSMIKLVFGSKNKIIKHQKRSFQELRQIITLNFPQAPFDCSLSYIDEDKDEICLNSDQDLTNMLRPKAKMYKVYIKQSLTQTIVVDLDTTQQIQTYYSKILEKEDPKQEEEPASKAEEIRHNNVKENNIKKQSFVQKNQVVQQIEVDSQLTAEKEKEQAPKIVPDIKQQKIQQKFQQIIEVPKQKLQISEVILKKSQKPQIIAIKLQISNDKRVVSKMQEMSKPIHVEASDKRIRELFEDVQDIKQIQKKEQPLQVHNVICSNCKDDFGILGVRYQCLLCNYFNLCSKCQASIQHQHALLKVKAPKQAITQKLLVEKFRKEIYEPPKQKEVPAGHYLPSIDKQDAYRILNTAKQAYQGGINRAKRLFQDLFTKMEKNHQNPYEAIKPIQNVEKNSVKAHYLNDLVGISYNEALRFVSQYPSLDKQRITEIYFKMKK